ncbi:Putative uncharacterized protein [Lactococcus lactis subsp. lactis A12]|uniref:Uncharacterized protein n=1 Tax=Lactococcus lactis subsp. lactis A12 TaxID=1137134 RepID=S6EXL0_LACLL|nr:Putative uncharacterized protein [Lactococcus lactis subsp. lactis A12]SBW29547.1 Hypothetical protein LLA12_00372 [Lactococcus lactis subsp. lactis]
MNNFSLRHHHLHR